MNVSVLAENYAVSDEFESEHGLSLFVDTRRHRLLFDFGASGLFERNANQMGVDLSNVDIAVLSHGHYDHGGGLRTFFQINQAAKVYLQARAFEAHYSKRAGGETAYIGLDQSLLPNNRYVFCGESRVIDDELEVFSDVSAQRLAPASNKNLLVQSDGGFARDEFAHEQNLIVRKNGGTLLIAGCAHKGIVNIVERFHEKNGAYPDVVIGGFHLSSRGALLHEDADIVDAIGKNLLNTNALYYTGHCTGKAAFERLKAIMGEKIRYISGGDQFDLSI